VTGRWRGGVKPLDVGNGLVCASFGSGGAWLSLGTVHADHGFVELSGLPPFDEAWRGSADLVRHYRTLMSEDRYAFLSLQAVPAAAPVEERSMPFASPPRSFRRYSGWTLSAVMRAPSGVSAIGQTLRLRANNDGSQPSAVRLVFRGRLDRPALAMITEVGQVPPVTHAVTELEAQGSELRVLAGALPAEAVIRLESRIDGAAWQLTDEGAQLELTWPRARAELTLQLTCSLTSPAGGDRRGRVAASARVAVWDHPAPLVVSPALRPQLERMRGRALRYVRDCTALQVSAGRVAILTDHRLLPLSWTRDAYYQALLLLTDRQATIVADHLRWLWLTCERPAATWARSHHANGRRKDPSYQADQQLYPLLELADYWRATGRVPELEERAGSTWRGLVAEVLDALAGTLSADGMLATEENAADDPVEYPYVLASQILAWYTFGRLAEMSDVLSLPLSLVAVAEQLRAAVEGHFVVNGPSGKLWAYAVDGQGGRTLDHDANDLPTAFAPLWGFCTPADSIWRRTMDFAFSTDNPAYAGGRWGGLGSRHTPGTWPLGLIQEWVAMSLMDEPERASEALRRLVATGFSDGSLPEASDPDTARAIARHWFAWPGALLGALIGSAYPVTE
jgi:hypothetical protein